MSFCTDPFAYAIPRPPITIAARFICGMESLTTSWRWAFVLASYATGLTVFLLLLRGRVALIIASTVGASATECWLKLRFSAVFRWLLLVVDVSIVFSFAALGMVVLDSGQLLRYCTNVAAACWPVGPLVWTAVGARGLFLLLVSNNMEQRQDSLQRRGQHFLLDTILLCVAATTLLPSFPWPAHRAAVTTQKTFVPDVLVDNVLVVFISVCFVGYLGYVALPLRHRLRRETNGLSMRSCYRLKMQLAFCQQHNGPRQRVHVTNLIAGGLNANKGGIATFGGGCLVDAGDDELSVWHALNWFAATGGPLCHFKAPTYQLIAWAWACWYHLQHRKPIVWVQPKQIGAQPRLVCLLVGGVAAVFDRMHFRTPIVPWPGVKIVFENGVPRRKVQPPLCPSTAWMGSTNLTALAGGVTWLFADKLFHQAPCDGLDGVTHVDVNNLQVSQRYACRTKRIYVRAQAAEQWTWLQELGAQNSQHRVLQLRGAHGTGKTILAWAWACFVAQGGRCVLWVRGRDRLRYLRVTLLRGGNAFFGSCEQHLVDRVATQNNVDVVILVGTTGASSAQRWATAPGKAHRRLVVVARSWVPYAMGTNVNHAQVGSWTRAEYDQACCDVVLWDQVKTSMGWLEPSRRAVAHDERNECEFQRDHEAAEFPMLDDAAYNNSLRDAKFYVAGASVRWMFRMTTAQVARSIYVSIDTMSGRDVDHPKLRATFRNGGHQAISSFARRMLAHRLSQALSTDPTRRVPDPAQACMALEGRLLQRVVRGTMFGGPCDYVNMSAVVLDTIDSSHDGQSTTLRIDVGNRVGFKADNVSEIHNSDIQDHTWFFPSCWTRCGFAVAFYQAEHRCLFFVQIAAGHHHYVERWTTMNAFAWAVTCRLVTQAQDTLAAPKNVGTLPVNYWHMNRWQREQVAQHGVRFVELLYLIPAHHTAGFAFKAEEEIESVPFWLHTHTRTVLLAPYSYADDRLQTISSQAGALGQEGGLQPRDRHNSNDDWRSNFPLRPHDVD